VVVYEEGLYPVDLTGTGTVDRPERVPERLRRSIAVPDGDAQQIVLSPDDLGGGQRRRRR
jgi:hypothetical protein